jgi:hypothetical protein
MLSPIRDGRVLYPKISLNLNRKDGKTDENDSSNVRRTLSMLPSTLQGPTYEKEEKKRRAPREDLSTLTAEE